VGRLSREKNVDKLLAAVAKLKAQSVSLDCTVIGVGPMRPALEALVTEQNIIDRVRFAGGMDFGQVLDFYEQADIVVLASETEGWPKAVTEAMAFGLICIGSDQGWMRDMLGEGRGIVVPAGDVQALAKTLQQIAQTPESYKEMSERASAWAQNFSLEGMQEALRNLLETRWQISIEPSYQPATRTL